jgi:hypothetical protein
MKLLFIRPLFLAAVLTGSLALVAGCSDNHPSSSSHVVSHSESDKTGWFGGQTHQANTTYKNSDGSTSIETETSSTKGNVTTITRERKTTTADGKVSTDHETRTVVKGSDNTVRETKTSN